MELDPLVQGLGVQEPTGGQISAVSAVEDEAPETEDEALVFTLEGSVLGSLGRNRSGGGKVILFFFRHCCFLGVLSLLLHGTAMAT